LSLTFTCAPAVTIALIPACRTPHLADTICGECVLYIFLCTSIHHQFLPLP
jgi:hypothetical protein